MVTIIYYIGVIINVLKFIFLVLGILCFLKYLKDKS